MTREEFKKRYGLWSGKRTKAIELAHSINVQDTIPDEQVIPQKHTGNNYKIILLSDLQNRR